MTLDERLERFLGCDPVVAPDAYVHPAAVLIGDVSIGSRASVWPGAVLRGDIERIVVGEGSNIQDGVVMHLADDKPCVVGKYTTVGHRAMLHACHVGDECLIGMSATILDGAVIGDGSIVAAGALVTKGTQVPSGSMVMGAPAKVVRPLTVDERGRLRGWAEKYLVVSAAHRAKANRQSSGM